MNNVIPIGPTFYWRPWKTETLKPHEIYVNDYIDLNHNHVHKLAYLIHDEDEVYNLMYLDMNTKRIKECAQRTFTTQFKPYPYKRTV